MSHEEIFKSIINFINESKLLTGYPERTGPTNNTHLIIKNYY